MPTIGKYNAAIYRNIQSILNHKLQDLSISSGQHDFLYVISKFEGITSKELSERLYVGKSTTAKAVKNLMINGYIRKEKDQNDKRCDHLFLTDKGKEIAPRIQKTFIELRDLTADSLSTEEVNQTITNLQKVLGSLYQEKVKLYKEGNAFGEQTVRG